MRRNADRCFQDHWQYIYAPGGLSQQGISDRIEFAPPVTARQSANIPLTMSLSFGTKKHTLGGLGSLGSWL
jgi:hypothetical protein